MVSNGQPYSFALIANSPTFVPELIDEYFDDMKKFIVVAFLMVLMISMYVVKTTKSQADSLLLNNVEAIAAEEWDGRPTRCIGTGKIYCPVTHDYVEIVVSGYSLEDFN